MVSHPGSLRDYVRTTATNSIVVQPTAGAIIADSGAIPSGEYDVQVAGSYGAVADAIDNMQVFQAGAFVTALPVIPLANSPMLWITLPGMVISEGEHITIRANAAGAAGAVYRGTIVVTPIRTQYGR